MYFDTANVDTAGSEIHDENGGAVIGHTCSPGLSGNGNLSSDPQFVNAAASNYRLLASSPCINAGLNQSWMATATDLNGLPRIAGGTVDLGACECPLGMVVITNTVTAVPASQTSIVLGGTNSPDITGVMSYSDATTAKRGTLAAAPSWSLPALDLLYGPNRITVSGTNRQGVTASDSITIVRQMTAPGNCLAFNGTNAYVDLGANNALALTNGPFTLEAWINPLLQSNICTIVGRKNGGLPNPGYALYINSWETADGRLVFETQGQKCLTPNPVITWGVWQHVAATWDRTNLAFYVNGSCNPLPAASTSPMAASLPNSAPSPEPPSLTPA